MRRFHAYIAANFATKYTLLLSHEQYFGPLNAINYTF